MSTSNSYRERRTVLERRRFAPAERSLPEARPSPETEPSLRPDGGVDLADWTTLTGFQRDVMVAIAWLAKTGETCSGVAVKHTLETELGYDELGPSQLYHNLDALDAKGLVGVSSVPNDERVNHYVLTARGRTLLDAHARFVAAVVGVHRSRTHNPETDNRETDNRETDNRETDNREAGDSVAFDG